MVKSLRLRIAAFGAVDGGSNPPGAIFIILENNIKKQTLIDYMIKKGRLNTLTISLNVIGFALLFLGGALIRFSKDEVYSILGGFVLAGGVAVLSITRLVSK